VIPDTLNILRAERLGDYRLAIDFDDGTKQVVDFKPFLISAQHPEIRTFLDMSKFSAFRIEYGDLVWGDYALCFPIEDIYRNRITPISEGKAVA
jgi:Protein of unknown function (DUF2442)